MTCPVHAETFALSEGQCAAPVVEGAAETCGRPLVPASAEGDAAGSALRLPPGVVVPTDGAMVSATSFTVEAWLRPSVGAVTCSLGRRRVRMGSASP